LREQFRLLYRPQAAAKDFHPQTSPGQTLDGNNGHTS